MRVGHILIPLVIVYVFYSLTLAAGSHAGFPKDMQSGLLFPYLADKPVGEDGYYMLTVAWNIACGRGVVYNYDLPTTGIQPLSTLIYAMLAWVVQFFRGDRWVFIRVMLLFGSINLLVFGHIVGVIVRTLTDTDTEDIGYILGFIGVVFNFALFRWFTYGLETGIYLTLFALCILYTSRRFKTDLGSKDCNRRRREAIVLGVLGGVTIWARIDFGIVFLVFLGVSLLRRQFNILWVIATGTITTLVVSPWFLYNLGVTGHWMPSSGAAQAALITRQDAFSRLWTMGKAILSHLTPWIYSNTGGVFTAAAVLSSLAVLVFLFRERATSAFLLSELKQQPHFTTWLFGAATLTLIYPVFFWAGHFYQRYSAPIVIPLTVIMALTVSKRIRASTKTLQMTVVYTLPVCFFAWAFLSLHTGRIGNTHAVTAGVVQNHFGSVRVGAFQSGVIGFFDSNVINLDGKVNRTALDYMKKGKLQDYIDSQKIDILVDWPGYIYGSLDANYLAANWNECRSPVPNGASICLQRKTSSVK